MQGGEDGLGEEFVRRIDLGGEREEDALVERDRRKLKETKQPGSSLTEIVARFVRQRLLTKANTSRRSQAAARGIES